MGKESLTGEIVVLLKHAKFSCNRGEKKEAISMLLEAISIVKSYTPVDNYTESLLSEAIEDIQVAVDYIEDGFSMEAVRKINSAISAIELTERG